MLKILAAIFAFITLVNNGVGIILSAILSYLLIRVLGLLKYGIHTILVISCIYIILTLLGLSWLMKIGLFLSSYLINIIPEENNEKNSKG
mgnify:CR=1 FL=1